MSLSAYDVHDVRPHAESLGHAQSLIRALGKGLVIALANTGWTFVSQSEVDQDRNGSLAVNPAGFAKEVTASGWFSHGPVAKMGIHGKVMHWL